jgi:hypothetical protein
LDIADYHLAFVIERNVREYAMEKGTWTPQTASTATAKRACLNATPSVLTKGILTSCFFVAMTAAA